MGNYGIMLSNEGDNILNQVSDTAKFSTKYSTLKVFMENSAQFTTNGSGDGSVTISHGMGYAPAFFVWRKGTASWTFMDASSYTNSYTPVGCSNKWFGYDGNGYSYMGDIHAYSDSSNLVIMADGAQASTTYYFKYYILVDLAKEFTGASSISTTNDYGYKVSKEGYDVLNCEEYQLAYSSKYKSLQYFEESFKSNTLTLPIMWASRFDSQVEAGTYVDFAHGLGYQPFFLASAKVSTATDTNAYRQIPYNDNDNIHEQESFQIGCFCDATRVRISFYQVSNWTALEGTNPTFSTAATITIKLYIFTENLNG